MSRRQRVQTLRYRADQSGMLLAAANVPLTFQRTLMPRPTVDQAIVTGLSIATNHAFVSLIQESIQSTALVALRRTNLRSDNVAWGRMSVALDAVAIGAGIGLQRRFRQRHRERLPRAAARTGGYWLTMTGSTGAIIGGLQEAVGTFKKETPNTVPVVVPAAGVLAALLELWRRRAERLDVDLPSDGAAVAPLKALGLGVGVAASVSVISLGERVLADRVARIAARVLPVSEEVALPLGHALALATLGSATKFLVERALGGIEHKETSVEAAFDIPPPNPYVSGSVASTVAFESLSKQGRRFVWTVTAPEKIRAVMGEDVAVPPIRIYAGLACAESEDERVALVLDDLERTGAFERSWLLVASPTGTGYVNYAAVTALELLARGDCATVAMQYAARPSVLSLDRVHEGRAQARMLLDALRARLATIPEPQRPKFVLFGESLGAWTSQDPFVDRGTQGLVDTGIDHAIWIGTPHFSKWKEQVLYDGRHDVDPGVVRVFSNIREWQALDPEERAGIRYLMITHHDDGVALFGPELAIQAPDWLGPRDSRPPEVPKSMRWMPTTAFFQVLVDMKNSANVVPGKFAAKGHDYRADLLPFFNAALGLDATDAQLDAIAAWLEAEELARSQWITDHGTAGKSLAATVVERALTDLSEQGLDRDDHLARIVRTIAEEEFGAGGGANIPIPEHLPPG
ncbi:MAG: alpha/beta-hydrolase family protein [Acidimicrobiia bacterium]